MNKNGFSLKISCGNRVDVQIRQARITEYDGSAGIVHLADIAEEKHVPPSMPPTGKPNPESCIAELPAPLRIAVSDICRLFSSKFPAFLVWGCKKGDIIAAKWKMALEK